MVRAIESGTYYKINLLSSIRDLDHHETSKPF